MRIWLIKVGEEIPDDPGTPRMVRTGILARLLAERGHEVTWWNSTFSHQRKIQRFNSTTEMRSRDGYRLVLLAGQPYRRNISVRRVLNHRETAHEFRRCIEQETVPDIIVCSYPLIELAEAATSYASKNGVPIVVDFRDKWPDAFEELVPKGLTWTTRPFIDRLARKRAKIVREATSIVGITDEFVSWALAADKRCKGPLDRAFHLAVDPSPPLPAQIAEGDAFWDSQGIVANTHHLVGCYMGTLSRRLDLKTLVLGALQLSPDEQSRIKLVICGRGDVDAELRAIKASAPRGAPHVLLPGWRNAGEIAALLKRSHFGLLPYPSLPDFLASYPNKVGEYLSEGLPILTGLQGATHDLLQKTGVRIGYETGNSNSLAESLRQLLAEPDQLREMKSRAKGLFESKFNPTVIYDAYCEHLVRVFSQGRHQVLGEAMANDQARD